MRFSLFRHGKHRQSPAEVRAERDALAVDNADLRERLAAADDRIAQLEEERDWFHAHWMEAGHQAIEAGLVVKCLDEQLVEARRIRADLEAIAGPHVPSDGAPTPLFEEVTQEIPLPVVTVSDAEATVETAVMSLADAVGAR